MPSGGLVNVVVVFLFGKDSKGRVSGDPLILRIPSLAHCLISGFLMIFIHLDPFHTLHLHLKCICILEFQSRIYQGCSI